MADQNAFFQRQITQDKEAFRLERRTQVIEKLYQPTDKTIGSDKLVPKFNARIRSEALKEFFSLEVQASKSSHPILSRSSKLETWLYNLFGSIKVSEEVKPQGLPIHVEINLDNALLQDVLANEFNRDTKAAISLVIAKLHNSDLSFADLSGANLRGADLRGADLSDAKLSDSNLSDANLSDAVLVNTDLSGARLKSTNLSNAFPISANLSRAYLANAVLVGADLTKANLEKADLTRADLSGADLSYTNLRKAELFKANLSGANLKRADLREADLTRANLRDADFDSTNLSSANLSKVSLYGVIFSNTLFNHTLMRGYRCRSVSIGACVPE